jgi:hypothetical protein
MNFSGTKKHDFFNVFEKSVVWDCFLELLYIESSKNTILVIFIWFQIRNTKIQNDKTLI